MLPDKMVHCIVFMKTLGTYLVPLGASQSVISLSHIYPLTPLHVRGSEMLTKNRRWRKQSADFNRQWDQYIANS
jgi:hypothetical protein